MEHSGRAVPSLAHSSWMPPSNTQSDRCLPRSSRCLSISLVQDRTQCHMAWHGHSSRAQGRRLVRVQKNATAVPPAQKIAPHRHPQQRERERGKRKGERCINVLLYSNGGRAVHTPRCRQRSAGMHSVLICNPDGKILLSRYFERPSQSADSFDSSGDHHGQGSMMRDTAKARSSSQAEVLGQTRHLWTKGTADCPQVARAKVWCVGSKRVTGIL